MSLSSSGSKSSKSEIDADNEFLLRTIRPLGSLIENMLSSQSSSDDHIIQCLKIIDSITELFFRRRPNYSVPLPYSSHYVHVMSSILQGRSHDSTMAVIVSKTIQRLLVQLSKSPQRSREFAMAVSERSASDALASFFRKNLEADRSSETLSESMLSAVKLYSSALFPVHGNLMAFPLCGERCKMLQLDAVVAALASKTNTSHVEIKDIASSIRKSLCLSLLENASIQAGYNIFTRTLQAGKGDREWKMHILRILLQLSRQCDGSAIELMCRASPSPQKNSSAGDSILAYIAPLALSFGQPELASLSLLCLAEVFKCKKFGGPLLLHGLKMTINDLIGAMISGNRTKGSSDSDANLMLVALSASFVISSLMDEPSSARKLIAPLMDSRVQSFFTTVLERIDPLKEESKVERAFIQLEGTSFGLRPSGYCDGVVAILYKGVQQGGVEFVGCLCKSGVWRMLCENLGNASSLSWLSPTGTRILLDLFNTTLSMESLNSAGYTNLLLEELDAGAVKLLHENRLQKLVQWPEISGGGPANTSRLVEVVTRLILLAMGHDSVDGNQRRKKTLYNHFAVQHFINTIYYMDADHVDAPISILRRLVSDSKFFARQFVGDGGLETLRQRQLLHPSNPPGLLVDVLVILCQLARLDHANYEHIHDAAIYDDLRSLLSHQTAEVRQNACNLVGNMCRHSHFFYPHLKSTGILPPLIECCRDPDDITSKFACFAIGNAVFYNADLCSSLSKCIPYLVDAVSGRDSKISANAAGALGNIVRNSDMVVPEILEAGTIEALLTMIGEPSYAVHTRRYGLFALGNICSFESCCRRLNQLDYKRVLKSVDMVDEETRRYIRRIRQKMDQYRDAGR